MLELPTMPDDNPILVLPTTSLGEIIIFEPASELLLLLIYPIPLLFF